LYVHDRHKEWANGKAVRRRRFLALFGAGALGTAGAVAGRALGLDGSANRPAGTAGRGVELPESGVRRIVWSVETATPAMALTFDDGPNADLTPRILDILDDFGVRATFMAMGYSAVRHPRLLQDVVAAGHEVGNHTWSHRNLAGESAESTYREMERGARAIGAVTGRRTTLFRPPRGEFTADAVRAAAGLRHDVILWSVERREPAGAEPRRLADDFTSRTGPGDIVLLHDGYGRGTFAPDAEWAARLRRRRADEVAALPTLLSGLREQGLRLLTLSELLRLQEDDR